MKHTIWSNIDLDLDDWKDDLMEEAEENGWSTDEASLYDLMCETNNGYLDDERAHLNVDAGGQIICICDLGLWNGRRDGYRIMKSSMIGDCLTIPFEYASFYVDDDNDFCAKTIHHDGCNYYTFRVIRPDCEDELDRITDAIVEGDPDAVADLYNITDELGSKIANVYGWQ